MFPGEPGNGRLHCSTAEFSRHGSSGSSCEPDTGSITNDHPVSTGDRYDPNRAVTIGVANGWRHADENRHARQYSNGSDSNDCGDQFARYSAAVVSQRWTHR